MWQQTPQGTPRHQTPQSNPRQQTPQSAQRNQAAQPVARQTTPQSAQRTVPAASKYGGPGTSYSGGRLPPRIKDLIVHYFYLLGLNPNHHACNVPEDYEERDLDKLAFIPPPPDFVIPVWADPKDPDDDSEMSRAHTLKSHKKTLSSLPSSPL